METKPHLRYYTSMMCVGREITNSRDVGLAPTANHL